MSNRLMHENHLTAAIFTASLLAAPFAIAQDGGMGMKPGMMQGCGERMRTMMDADKDGKVAKEEFMKHHEDMFATMDKDSDKTLDQSEMGGMDKMMESHCPGMKMHQGMGGGGM